MFYSGAGHSMWLKLQQSHRQVSIAGQVSDAETGQVIAGAVVALTQMPESFRQRLALQALQYGDRWSAMSQRPDRTYTSRDGYFKFIDLPAGSYRCTVALPSAGTRYGTAETEVIVPSEITDQTANQSRRPLNILDIELPPTALKGKIQDAKGEPIEMVKIQISGNREYILSDTQGNYSISALEASSSDSDLRRVTASAQGYNSQSSSVILNFGKTQILNFKLQRK